MNVQQKAIANSRDLFTKLPGKPAYYYIGTYFVIIILLFHSTLFSKSNLLFGTDLMEAGVFLRHILTSYFNTNFAWPAWDPYIHGGIPFIEGMHGDIFYIPSFIFYILFDFTYAWGFILAFHILLAGIFMYLFLRDFDIRGSIAFLGGLLYMMAPLLVSLVYAGHNGKIFVIAQTPLIFLIYRKAIRSNKIIYYLLLAFIIFLGVTSAHMQMSYYLFFTLGAYFVVTTIQKWRKDGVNPIKPAALFVGAVVLGLLMSAVQYITPYQYLHSYSMRTLRTQSENKYDYATSWSMNWEELTADFFPEFVGDNVQGQRTTYWGKNVFKLNSEHFGIIALFLSILAIGLWNRRGKWFFFWIAIIATLYALGANTPAFRLFYLLPGVKSFRAPGMINYLVGFSVITLAAMGLESFFSTKKSDLKFKKTWKAYTYISIGYSVFAMMIIILQMGFFRLWFGIFGTPDSQKVQTLQSSLDIITLAAVISLIAVWGMFLLLKFYIDKKIKANLIIIGLAVFTFLYMWHFDSRFIIPINPKPQYESKPVVDYLKARQQDEKFRVFVLPQTVKDYYLAYHDIEELSLTIMHGNHLATFEELAGRGNNSTPGLLNQPVQDLLNAKYFISSQALPPQYFSPQRFKLLAKPGGILVYENRTALPRAFPMYRYTVVSGDDQIIKKLNSPGFDYQGTVILDKAPENPPPVYPDSVRFPVVAARVYDSENGSFKVDVDMLHDGFLFLSENYYPAWKASEDGIPLTTLRGDLNFRAIPLTEGHHTIVCRFDNKTLNASFAISKMAFVFGLLLLVGLIINDYLRRKHKPENA